MKRMALAAIMLLGGLTAPAFGQVKIEWKFKEGDKFYVEEVANVKNTVSIMGKQINEVQKTTTLASFTVKRASAKEVVMEQKIESVDVATAEKGLGGDMGKFMEKMKGAKFTITMDPSSGKVTKFDGYKEMLKNLSDGNEEVAKFMEMMITEDTLRKGSEDAFGFLPSKAVNNGDSWKTDSVMPMGPLGSFKKTGTYTYAGKADNGEKIDYKMDMTYQAPKGEGALGGLFTVKKGNLKVEGAKGTIVFDAEKGRMVSNNVTMRFAGSLTMDVMGNELILDMTMDQTSSTRVLNRAPKSDN